MPPSTTRCILPMNLGIGIKEAHVPSSKGILKERLSRYRQIKINVIGRKSGQTISIPVWFVLAGNKLYLLPVQGSDTHRYKKVLQNPSTRIDAPAAAAGSPPTPTTTAK